MSGAAGLAAAKRRRAAAPAPRAAPRRTTLQPSPSSSSSEAAPTPAPAPAPAPSENQGKLTPLQALNQHETRIKELESESSSLDKEIAELKQTILKMQTFAIEQSLELTKLRKGMSEEPPKTE